MLNWGLCNLITSHSLICYDSQFHSSTFTFLYSNNQPCLLNCIHCIIQSLIRSIEIPHLFTCHPHRPFEYSLYAKLFLPPCLLDNCNKCFRVQQKCPVPILFSHFTYPKFYLWNLLYVWHTCSCVVIFLMCFFPSGVFLWLRYHLCDAHCCIHSIPNGAWHTVET